VEEYCESRQLFSGCFYTLEVDHSEISDEWVIIYEALTIQYDRLFIFVIASYKKEKKNEALLQASILLLRDVNGVPYAGSKNHQKTKREKRRWR